MSLKRFISETLKEYQDKPLGIELIRSSKNKPTWNISVIDCETDKRIKIFTFETAPLLQQVLDVLIESKLPVTISGGYLIESKTAIEFTRNNKQEGNY